MLICAPCGRVEITDKDKGLAISGGVDSMALATLCSGLRESSQKDNALSFTAFIVDHGLRPGSRNEAVKVAGFLERLSMLAWQSL
jgi:tRNA(Ile)-lysidine synthase